MSAKTKIVVLKMKELIYTAVFVGLAILLIAIGWAMFRGGDENSDKNTHKTPQTTNDSHADVDTSSNADPQYIPGVYTASLPLSSHSLDVEVIVDTTRIKSVRLVDLQESIAAMYPLIEPTMTSVSAQILSAQSTNGITYEDTSKYTAYVLVQAIQNALAKAAAQ